eukprot:4757771-Amphidinium_carterae.1
MTRSPFWELTNACPEDQALAYQPAVMKELARKAYLLDHAFTLPESTLLAGVVKPETEPYQCGAGWPFMEVKVAKASTHQYHQADLKHRRQRILEDTSSGSRVGEDVMADVSAATSSGSRVGEGRNDEPLQRGEVHTSSGSRVGEDVENEDSHGDLEVVYETEMDNLATVRPEEPQEMEVDQGAIPDTASNAGYSDAPPVQFGGLSISASAAGIRQSRDYLFALIQQQEYLLNEFTQKRDLVEAGSARHNDLNERIALTTGLIHLYNQALARIHQYAPAMSLTPEAEHHS